jgi:hypothetical protein
MSQTDRVEVMDFLINVLKDHEKNLDTLITRAEDVIDEKQSPQMVSQNLPPLKIILRDWDEFKDRAIEAELVCFDMIDSMFLCNAITKNKVFSYTEHTPDVELEMGENKDLIMKGLDLSNLEEGIAALNGQLHIGLQLKATKVRRSDDHGNQKHHILHDLDSLYTRNWLSSEIGIHRDYVVHGIVD